MKFIQQSDQVVEFFNQYMKNENPTFISRIGGTDWELVCDYFNDKTVFDDDTWYRTAIRKAREIQGYFDYSNDKETFRKYLETLITGYESADLIMYAGKMEKHVRHFVNGKTSDISSRFKPFMEHIGRDKTFINWNDFIQIVRPFLSSFETWGNDKKILIISPLSKSIEYQYLRKDKLFTDYTYPDFILKTFNTAITYNNDEDSRENFQTTTNNWNEECQRLADGIKDIDFDIALLSCASYSMFLGNYIKTTLGKQAIYFGGSLNVYFNIYGKRFDKLYDQVGLDPEYLIEAFENKDIENIKGGRAYPNECLDAYFGKKND
jgi:hypothetical protein